MLSYPTLKDKPRVLRAFTSLDREEFETLLHPFEQAWEAYVTHHLRHKQARKRRYGGGRQQGNRIMIPLNLRSWAT